MLRIATCNLLHGLSVPAGGALDLDAAGDAVAALDADVVALQEVDRGLERTGGVDQVAALASRTGLHGVFAPALLGDPGTRWRAVVGEDPGGPAYGVGLLTRGAPVRWRRVALPGGGDGARQPSEPSGGPDASTASRPSSAAAAAGPGSLNPGWDHEPRTALLAELDVAGLALQIVTTHLSYLPWRGVAQLRTALAAPSAGPAVLLGDLNLPVWVVRALSADWHHAGGQPTYPAWRPRLQPDQVLVRGGIGVHDVQVGRPGTSDHLPLTARLVVSARR